MREKYESLSATVLKDLAKARGLKNISSMKKSDLVELMLAEDEKQAKEKKSEAAAEPRAEGAVKEDASSRENAASKDGTTPEDTLKDLDSGITANGLLVVEILQLKPLFVTSFA